IAGSAFASTMSGGAAVSDNGVVSFQCVGPGVDGVYAAAPLSGQVVTLIGSAFGNERGAPAASAVGGMVFQGAGGGIYARSSISDGTVLTLQGTGFARMGRPAVNTALDIAFLGAVDDGSGTPPGEDAIFVRIGSGNVITLEGSNFGSGAKLTSSQPKIV